MLYCLKGMTYADILDMDPSDRKWYLRRLNEQLREEHQAMRKSATGVNVEAGKVMT